MKKVMSLPSSPAATRKNSKNPKPSPKMMPAKLVKRPKESKQSKKHSKKKLALSLKLTDDEFSDTTTSIGGSSDSADEDEWESSFDPAWVVDEHELALHRQWTDQKGFTSGLPGVQKPSGALRRSPLATNSALSSSFASLPAADHPTAGPSFAGPDGGLLVSGKPAPAFGSGNVLSYADLSARSRHSPASSPREHSATSSSSSPPFASAASSLLPALDLDRVVISALGSSASRRNTISSPHEAREGTKPFDPHAAVGQWKVGKISPREGENERGAPETAKNESEGGQENEESEAARVSPRLTDLQIACERFEHLAQKEPKKSGSKRKSAKKAHSLNKKETTKEKRREEERRSYRRSQGSPPMLPRGLGERQQRKPRGGSDSESGAAGYLAEEDPEYDSHDSDAGHAALTSGSSGTKGEEQESVASGSAPVSPQSLSGTAAINLSWRLRAAEGLGSGGFPLSRSHSSEQVRARRMITKDDMKRDDARKEAAAAGGSPSPKRLSAEQPNNNSAPSALGEISLTEEDVDMSPRSATTPAGNEQETASGGSTELTWKTIWGGASPHSTEATGGVGEPKKVLKRGLEGRSSSLPPSPMLQPLSPSPSLPAHISPLPFPPFATSPPASLTSSPSLTPASSSPAMRLHRRRAESSGTPQPLPFALSPLLLSPTVDSINFRGHHHHRGMVTRTLSPGPSKRQAGSHHHHHHLAVPLARAGRDAESGEIAAMLLRTQSEDIHSVITEFEVDDADLEGIDDLHSSSRTGMRWPPPAVSTRRGGSWRGRSSDKEWRSRSRDAGPVSSDDCLATRRTRIERARSFGKGEEADLLAMGEEEDDLLQWEDDDGMEEEDDHLIEAELTSFLKRTRSGSQRSLRREFFEGGWRSPLSVRHGQLHDDDDTATLDEEDGGLESGESHGRETM